MPSTGAVTMWLRRSAAVCVMAALTIDVVAGRWGGYVATPVPNLYLPDLLWVLGCALGVSLAVMRALPRPVLVTSGVVAAYLVVRAALAVGGPGVERALVLRDLAPLAFVATVPLAAVALSRVPTRTLLWILRIAPFVTVTGWLMSALGAIPESISTALGGAALAGTWFPGRTEILGVALAIGVVAWGRFPQLTTPSNRWAAWAARAVQVLFVLLSVVAPSQGGQVAAGLAVVWAVLREWRPVTGRRAVVLGLAIVAVLGSITIALMGTAVLVTREQPVPVPLSTPGAVARADGTVPRYVSRDRLVYRVDYTPQGMGTILARMSTYSEVLHSSAADGTWLTGSGIGQPDRLLAACGVTLAEFEDNHDDNKCSVDSGLGGVLRDPHNWALNLLLYQGVVGVAIVAGALLAYWWRPPPDPAFSLTAIPAALYLVIASFSVIASAPFGILPIAGFTAFAISRRLRSDATDRVAASDTTSRDNL